MVTLYTTHCPKCNVLEKKLQAARVEFTVCEDLQKMLQLGFKSTPVLVVDKEDPYFFKEACIWADEMKKRQEQNNAD